jgi:hypothetical protein
MKMQTHLKDKNSTRFTSLQQSEDLAMFKKTGELNYDKIKDILGFTKRDISIATGIPLGLISLDENAPTELTRCFFEWIKAIELVHSFFNDQTKTKLWFNASNPMLGDVSPKEMIKFGRYKKLLQFIQTALAEGC